MLIFPDMTGELVRIIYIKLPPENIPHPAQPTILHAHCIIMDNGGKNNPEADNIQEQHSQPLERVLRPE